MKLSITFCIIFNLFGSIAVENVLHEINNTLYFKKHWQKPQGVLNNSTEVFALKCTAILSKHHNNQDTINRFTKIFNEMKDSKIRIKELHDEMMFWGSMISESDLTNIYDIERKFYSFAKDWEHNFTNHLEMLENSVDYDKLDEIIFLYENSNWTPIKLHNILNDFTPIKQKIKLMKLLQTASALLIDRRTNKRQILSDNYKQEVRIISLDLNTDISSPYIRRTVRLLEEQKDMFKYYIKNTLVPIPEVNIYLEGKKIRSFKVGKDEYILLKDDNGKVIILDAETQDQIATHLLSDIEFTIGAVVDNNYYIINTLKGTIISTTIENIIKPENSIKWDTVGSFASENKSVRNSATVNETYIYFLTFSGILYRYDTTLKTVTKVSTVALDDYYASLVVVNNNIYIHAYNKFYSYDGNTASEIATPTSKIHPGIFKMGNSVCRVGGNTTDVFPDPVDCYNLEDKTWNITSYINEFRWDTGIVTTQFGTYIFGGYAWVKGDSDYWRNTAEMFNFNKMGTSDKPYWSYIRSPLVNNPQYVQAISFFF